MSVPVNVRYWAGAARAAGCEAETIEATTVADLRRLLAQRPQLSAIAAVASFLVDGVHAPDAAQLAAGAQVDVLPPFAGGCAGFAGWLGGLRQVVGRA